MLKSRMAEERARMELIVDEGRVALVKDSGDFG